MFWTCRIRIRNSSHSWRIWWKFLEHNETIWTSAQLWWCGYVIRMDNCTMAPGVLVGELLVHWQFISLTRQFTNNTFCWQLASWVHLSTLLRSCQWIVLSAKCRGSIVIREQYKWYKDGLSEGHTEPMQHHICSTGNTGKWHNRPAIHMQVSNTRLRSTTSMSWRWHVICVNPVCHQPSTFSVKWATICRSRTGLFVHDKSHS